MKSKSGATKARPMAPKRTPEEGRKDCHRAGARIPEMELEPRPKRLVAVPGDSLLEMRAGDVIFLDESAELRPMVEWVFFAVLSCPCCATLGLITIPQYRGMQAVICGADDCSCRFRIEENTRFKYLAAS